MGSLFIDRLATSFRKGGLQQPAHRSTLTPAQSTAMETRTGTAGRRTMYHSLRIAYGVIWTANAWFQAHSGYMNGLDTILHSAAQDQPAWLKSYIETIAGGVAMIGSHWVAVITVAIDAALAASLLTGWAVRQLAGLGVVYSLFIWSALQGLGGPYGPGATDPGPGIVYAIAFIFVFLAEGQTMGGGPGEPMRKIPGQGLSGHDPFRAGRVLFGLLWAFDAYWKWHPYFFSHVLDLLRQGQQGEPAWMVTYIQFVVNAVEFVGPTLFAVCTAFVETFLAVSLLSGRWLRIAVPLGALFSLGIWTTAEGWGGPYTMGSTGMPGDVIGNAILYTYVFLYLFPFYGPAVWWTQRPAGRT